MNLLRNLLKNNKANSHIGNILIIGIIIILASVVTTFVHSFDTGTADDGLNQFESSQPNYLEDRESLFDLIAAFLNEGENVTLNHDDENDSLTINAKDTQLSKSEVKQIISDTIELENNTTLTNGTIEIDYPVNSVNNETGDVKLNHSDIYNISSDDHHPRYTDSEAINAINNQSSLDVGITGDADTVDGHHANDLATQSDVESIDDYPEMPSSKSDWPPNDYETIKGSYVSSSTSGEASDTIEGPAKIITGYASKSAAPFDDSYLKISLDGGSSWFTPDMSPQITAIGSGEDSSRAKVWLPPKMSIPEGETFKIKAGTSLDGSSSHNYGAGYYIKYEPLN